MTDKQPSWLNQADLNIFLSNELRPTTNIHSKPKSPKF